MSHDAFNDLEGLEELGQRDVEVMRHGRQPLRVDAPDVHGHDAAMLSAIEAASRRVGVSVGDIAVLAARKDTVKHYLAVLARNGIESLDLEKYYGRPVAAVKVGTFKRAKGLEFKFVSCPSSRTVPAHGGLTSRTPPIANASSSSGVSCSSA